VKSEEEANAISCEKINEKQKRSMAVSSRRRTSSIRAIFFDLDNTLINTRKGDKLACEKVL
jgi:hypothetical protein